MSQIIILYVDFTKSIIDLWYYILGILYIISIIDKLCDGHPTPSYTNEDKIRKSKWPFIYGQTILCIRIL